MHVSSGRWIYGFLLAMVTTVLWAVLPIMLKEILKGMDPYTVTWYRLFTAGVVLFVWLAWRRRLPSIRALSVTNRWLLVVAIVGLTLNYVLYLMGLSRLTPGTMQLMIQVAPIMLMLGSMWVFRERFGIGQLIGLLVLLAGFVLFFNQRLGELFTQMTSYTLGILITLGAALTWAVREKNTSPPIVKARLARHAFEHVANGILGRCKDATVDRRIFLSDRIGRATVLPATPGDDHAANVGPDERLKKCNISV